MFKHVLNGYLSCKTNHRIMKRICVTLTFTAVVFLCSNCFSQSKGVIFGTVTDGGLNEPLPFVNVGIPQIGIGAVSDLDGKYRLPNVPPGTHTLQFSYLGYAPKTREVTVVAGQGLEVDVTLAGEGVLMEEVVVKGQATGQRAAINQQINSNTIVNVISKEKLQELPDQNAAEAVGSPGRGVGIPGCRGRTTSDHSGDLSAFQQHHHQRRTAAFHPRNRTARWTSA